VLGVDVVMIASLGQRNWQRLKMDAGDFKQSKCVAYRHKHNPMDGRAEVLVSKISVF